MYAEGFITVNYLCIYPDEVFGSSVQLSGARAAKAQRVHAMAVGNTYAAVVLDTGRVSARVVAITDADIELQLGSIELPPAGPYIELVVGVSRPQTIRKILQAAVSFGVRRLTIVRSSTSEKSYFDTKLLTERELRQEILLESVEQTGAWYMPEVTVARKFLPFVQEELSNTLSRAHACGVVGIPAVSSSKSIQSHFIEKSVRVVCVGPEKGWSEFEQTALQSAGCLPVSLGPRMLRVEIAATALLAHATGV